VSDERFLEELKSYVGFTEEHARALAAARAELEPSFPRIIDRFYDAIQQNPRAMEVFTGGAAQIARQKNFLRTWLLGVFSGVYDLEYLQLRARIGRTHVRIRLDQRYMFTAMNLVREGLHTNLEQTRVPNKLLTHTAIDKICDIELAIMLQTYSEDYSDRLRDIERLALLGQLAGFIGHELRNTLAVMETSLHLLKKRLPAPDEHVARHLAKLSEHLTVSSNIIASLLELARDRPLERAPVGIESLLRSVTEGLPQIEQVELSIHVPEDLPEARLDEKQMRHLVGNLVTNAIQELLELPPGASRRVEIRAWREQDELFLSVDDSGRGISDTIRDRLFEPLATTRAKGLGLGLALCRRIVEKHGGHIRGLTSPLGGARFEVRLPHAFGE
jgi:signal transduction histidine kinase